MSDIILSTDTSPLEFQGVQIRTMTHDDGSPLWLARDVGRALQYSGEGKALLNLIRREWADEFEQGEEFIRSDVSGENDSTTPRGWSHHPQGEASASAFIWLTESGLNLVCAKTTKPIGKAFRRFIARVLQPLRAFQGAAPAQAPLDAKTQAMLEREARLRKKLELQVARTKARALRTLAKDCRARALDDAAIAVLEVKAAQYESGEDLSAYLPVQRETWVTATDIASDLGTTSTRIGLLVTVLGIRDDDRYTRKVDDKSPHSNKTVTATQYNAAGRDLIVEAFRAWQRGEPVPELRA